MSDSTYPPVIRGLVEARRALAPEIEDAFRAFSQKVLADGALSAKTKQLIAVAVAHVTQCPYCIKGHTKAARQHGATPEEIMEAIWGCVGFPAAVYANAPPASDRWRAGTSQDAGLVRRLALDAGVLKPSSEPAGGHRATRLTRSSGRSPRTDPSGTTASIHC
jgi:AhpD family alkylhydroperoxidase